MKSPISPCCLIGAGRAGSALAKAMAEKGYRFDWIVSRKRQKAAELAEAVGAPVSGDSIHGVPAAEGILIIAVPDKIIAAAAGEAAAADKVIAGKTVAFHLSGALGPEVLTPLKKKGAAVMAFHPGQTFSPGNDYSSVFKGICLDMEGDERACRTGAEVAEKLGAVSIVLTHDQRLLVHTAMSMASNYTAVLIAIAERLILEADCSVETARSMLAPLVRSTVANCFESGPVQALTGPAARGDIEVIQRHLDTLEKLGGNMSAVYRSLGLTAVGMGHIRGSISDESAEELRRLFGEKG